MDIITLNPFYLFTALVFGVLHALEPGHGKSLITTFVLSTNTDKKRDALFIGLAASLAHTASVYLVGFLGVKILEIISPEKKDILITFISSVLIFLIGLWLMWDRIIEPLFNQKHEHDCSAHKILTRNLRATNIIAIGLTAGLVPCSGGLAVFMATTSSYGIQSLILGFTYVLFFSIGLGLALTLVALSTILGKDFLNAKFQHTFSNIEKSSGVISAIVIYTLGLVLLTSNITKVFHPDHNHCHHCAHH